MPRIHAVVLSLLLAAVIHIDWHLARPLHHRLSLALPYHWVITATVFGIVGWLIARYWPQHRWTLGITAFIGALVIAQGIEPVLEALIYDGRLGYEGEPARWAAFWKSTAAAAPVYAATLWLCVRRPSILPAR